MANTRKNVRKRKSNKNDEEMGQKLPSICCRRRRNSKSKWRLFSSLKDATKIVVVKWGVNTIGFLLIFCVI